MEVQYDPALYLGCIVDPDRLQNLTDRSQSYANIAQAKDNLNTLLRINKEIEAITYELEMSGFDVENDQQLEDLKNQIKQKRQDYFNTATDECKNIAQYPGKGISKSIESPVDYTASILKTDFPLSADTMNCDVQYFTFDSMSQTSENHIKNVSTHVESSFRTFLGTGHAADAAKSARNSLAKLHENHSVQNTLVITCTCTHRNAAMFAPCIFDVKKLVSVWNDQFGKEGKESDDSIPGRRDPKAMKQEYDNSKISNNKLSIVTGASYGSGLVGLVTFVDDKETVSKEVVESMAESLAYSFKVRSFFCNATGNFSSAKEESSDVKSLLSTEAIQCHFNMYCAGLIPTIHSSKVKFGVKAFTDFDPAAMQQKLVAVQQMTKGSAKTIDEGADDARTVNIFQTLEKNQAECVLSSLKQMEDGEHDVLDVNTLMTAFENYANLAAEGNIGVPVNYYIKQIRRADVIDEWIKKFYPSLMFGEETAQAEDDAKDQGGDNGSVKAQAEDDPKDQGGDNGSVKAQAEDDAKDQGGDNGSVNDGSI